MIIKEFKRLRSRKKYKCNICKKMMKSGDDYYRHYTRDNPSALTMHPDCFTRTLKKEVMEWGLP